MSSVDIACHNCKRPFKSRCSNGKYCSLKCYTEFYRSLVTVPKRTFKHSPKKCSVCDETYTPNGPNSKFCSLDCVIEHRATVVKKRRTKVVVERKKRYWQLIDEAIERAYAKERSQ